jgi:hypothetical protein
MVIIPFLCIGQFDIDHNDQILHNFRFGDKYEVLINGKDKTLFITNDKGKVLKEKLKFADHIAGQYLQVLNKKNKIIYYNRALKKIKKPEGILHMVCGTVDSYIYKILEKDSNYLVQKTKDATWTSGEITTQIIDTITNKKFDEIYFINRSKILKFDDNYTYPTFLIFEKNSKYVIFDNNKQFIYDSVELKEYTHSNLVLVKKNDLYNFFSISPKVKYKRLDDFIFNLAYFELPNGKCGYIDIDGNEYFKKQK